MKTSVFIKLSIFLSFIVASFILFGFRSKAAISIASASDTSPLYGVVNTTYTNLMIRSQPDASSPTLGTLVNGSYIMIVGNSGDFYKVQYNNYGVSYGYVAKQYVNEMSANCPGKVFCNTSSSSLNVRSSSSANSSVVGSMAHAKWAPARASGAIGQTYFIVWGNVQGYVSNTNYLSYYVAY